MKLVVGLGNPGKKYESTRHNVGFDVAERLGQQWSAGRRREKNQGEITEASIAHQAVGIVRPLTFMNLSGQCVQPLRDFYKLDNADILVICDDFQLPLGQLRFRSKGSAGGQKGLADILKRCGGQDVPRLRIGIGEPPPQWDVADYVLSKFTKDEAETMAAAVNRAASAVVDWVEHGIDYCMNQYNTKGGSGD
jgi:PTH1 family peptidyl-tRNA hydrolase